MVQFNRRLAVVVISGGVVGFLIGTARHPKPPAIDLIAPPSTEEQVRWLEQVHFPAGDLPPEPTPEEIQQISDDLKSAAMTPVEANTIYNILRSDLRILAWLRRDQDRDGIRDFMLSPADGKFFECDTDVDGDGILNAVDSAPYDPNIGGIDVDGDQFPDRDFVDENANLIPDHVDWELIAAHRQPWFAEMQEIFYRKHKILLIERGFEFSESALTALDDAVNLVFGEFFRNESGLRSLRTVVAEPHVYLNEDPSDSTNGMMLSHSQTLLVYRSGLETPPSVQLGLLVHEIGHAIQYDEDSEPLRSIAELRGEEVPPSQFLQRMQSQFDWREEQLESDPEHTNNWYLSVYDGVTSQFFFQNRSSEQWLEWLKELESEVGEEFMHHPSVRHRHVIGSYSLGDPWEFHSDHLIAAVFTSIEDAAASIISPKEYQNQLQLFRNQIAEFWPDFAYFNARGGEYLESVRRELNIPRRNAVVLAHRYFMDQSPSLSRK